MRDQAADKIHGLTMAAAVWITAALGALCGIDEWKIIGALGHGQLGHLWQIFRAAEIIRGKESHCSFPAHAKSEDMAGDAADWVHPCLNYAP
jgi:uncharacterized membrane protein YhiD involved in acid resistance